MFNQVRDVLQNNCALNRKKPIIVGVSGGADSLTLLDILAKDYQVVVAHFNHFLRPESSKEARSIEKIATQKGLPFILGEGDVIGHTQAYHLSIEEAARNLRYRFLFDQAEKISAQAVAVAHNADDQVETVLMHLLRGAGLDGLTGMVYRFLPNPWSDSIPLVRPLLQIWRSEIESYCAKNRISILSDSTNADTTYFRNRIRHELIHELEAYVPGFRTRLWQTADLLSADRRILEERTEDVWREIGVKSEMGYVIFNLQALNLQSLGLKRRLIRKAISFLRPGARDVDFAMVQRAIDFVSQPTATRQADLGLGLRIAFDDGSVVILDWQTELPKEHWPQIADKLSGVAYHGKLPIPGEFHLGEGWIIKAEIPSEAEIAIRDARGNSDPYQVWIDLADRDPLLIVRSRHHGDRFRPLGMDGKSMKISDFMINQKLPQRARAGWPLVCYGDEIVWVPGFRMGHPFRITEQTHRIAKLNLKQS